MEGYFFSSHRYPFFLLLFLCFATAILGDSIAEALLLSHFSTSIIPKMYIVNALFLFICSFFVLNLIDRIDRGVFFHLFILSHCIILLIIWCATRFNAYILYIPLFSYAYVSKIFLFLLFWTLVNDSIDSHRAGKEFPLIAAGGTLGAIIISFTIPWFLQKLTTENLLLLWSLLLSILYLFFIPIRKIFGRDFIPRLQRKKERSFSLRSLLNDSKLLYKEPLLCNMSILYFLVFFIILNQHYIFYRSIKTMYQHASNIASFLGFFNGISMGVTLCLQITVAGIILKKIGSTRSMYLLPTVLCIVFMLQVIIGYFSQHLGNNSLRVQSIFWAIVAGVGMRIAFFDSFFSPNFQIFFSSLPKSIRGRGKLAIEGIIKPMAMVVASLWLLGVTDKISFTSNSFILFIVCCFMIIQTVRIKKKYTESLLLYLKNFHSATSDGDFNNLSSSKDVLSLMSYKLKHESFEVKCYIIQILVQMDTKDSIRILLHNLDSCDVKTQATIISSLAKINNEMIKNNLLKFLNSDDMRIVANCIEALSMYYDKEIHQRLIPFLHHDNNRIKANTIIFLWPFSNQLQKQNLIIVLKSMLISPSLFNWYSGLYALCKVETIDSVRQLLGDFYNRNSIHIQKDQRLLKHFCNAVSKHFTDDLIRCMFDLSTLVEKRRKKYIASCFVNICCAGYPIEKLYEVLKKYSYQNRAIILHALFILDTDRKHEYEDILISIAEEEMKKISSHLLSCNYLRKQSPNEAFELLMYSIREEIITMHINNVLRISAILDRGGRIKECIPKLTHENSHVRARALEILDNTGNSKINRHLIELIDALAKSDSYAPSIGPISNMHGKDKDRLFRIIDEYLHDSNEWVCLCTRNAQISLENQFQT